MESKEEKRPTCNDGVSSIKCHWKVKRVFQARRRYWPGLAEQMPPEGGAMVGYVKRISDQNVLLAVYWRGKYIPGTPWLTGAWTHSHQIGVGNDVDIAPRWRLSSFPSEGVHRHLTK